MNPSLHDLGWSDFFAREAQAFISVAAPDLQAALEVGRVVSVGRAAYQVWTAQGAEEALLAGILRQGSPGSPLPVIGDWLVVQRLTAGQGLRVLQVLPRRTTFARAVKGGAAEQILAANVDLVFIVTTPDQEFDLARLGRYVAAVEQSGARPVVLLNKTDLALDVTPFVRQIQTLAPGLPVHPVAAAQDQGLAAVRPYFQPGVTVALIGSSGVGKSTLTNALLGQEVTGTGAVREQDGEGRHTTTARTLYRVPGGGLLIDNPGLRDIAVWDAGGQDAGSGVIEELAAHCRFRKCTHRTEPGCAVRLAVQRGELSAAALAAYQQAQGLSGGKTRRR